MTVTAAPAGIALPTVAVTVMVAVLAVEVNVPVASVGVVSVDVVYETVMSCGVADVLRDVAVPTTGRVMADPDAAWLEMVIVPLFARAFATVKLVVALVLVGRESDAPVTAYADVLKTPMGTRPTTAAAPTMPRRLNVLDGLFISSFLVLTVAAAAASWQEGTHR